MNEDSCCKMDFLSKSKWTKSHFQVCPPMILAKGEGFNTHGVINYNCVRPFEIADYLYKTIG